MRCIFKISKKKRSISFHDRLLIASTFPFRVLTSLASQQVRGKLTEWCQVSEYFYAQLELAISKTAFPSVLCMLQIYSNNTELPRRQLQRFLESQPRKYIVKLVKLISTLLLFIPLSIFIVLVFQSQEFFVYGTTICQTY